MTTSEKRVNRFKSNFKDKNRECFDKEGNLENNNNNLDSINTSSNENSNLIPDAPIKAKVPFLLNSLEAIYDMNSDRNKKRLEQIKMRKTKLGNEIKDSDNKFDNLMRDNKIKVITTKKYQEEQDEINYEENKTENINPLEEPKFPLMVKDEKENENENEKDENVEIVVSDLEGEIEDKIVINNTRSKSFIPLTNHLKSKSSFDHDKATPSYLMALGLNDDDESNNINDDINFCISELSNQKEKASKKNPINNKNNYFVSDVIEEETSENNTDSEILCSKKKSAFLFHSKGSSKDNISNQVDSPTLLSARSSNAAKSIISNNKNIYNIHTNNPLPHKFLNFNREFRHSNSDIPAGNYYKENLQNINPYPDNYFNNHATAVEGHRLLQKKFHKNSKSEFFSFKVDVHKIIEDIQVRREEEANKRKEMMKLRKNVLLNKFLKSNSHHNFAKNYNISLTSMNMYKKDKVKKLNVKRLSIGTPVEVSNDKIFKKLNPSELYRSLYYDKDSGSHHKKKSEKTAELLLNYNSECREQEFLHDKMSFNSRTEEKVQREENCEVEMQFDVEDLDGNRSIIVEKADENVNFESELNLQLEKNDIKEEYNEDNYMFNDQEQDILSHDSHSKENNTKPIEKDKKFSFDMEDLKTYKLAPKNIFNTNFNNNIFASNHPNLTSVNKNLNNIFNKEKENSSYFKNSNFLSSFLTKDVNKSGRSNSLTFLPPLNYIEKKSTPLKRENKSNSNLEIARASILQITPQNPQTFTSSDKHYIFNHNHINKNFNHTSVNFMNSDFKARQVIINRKNPFIVNTITNDLKNKFATHVKSSSAFLLKPNITKELRYESTSSSNNFKTGQSTTESNKFTKGLTYSELLNSRKTKMLMHKKDLRQFLTYSDSKPKSIELSKSKNLFNYLIQINSNGSSFNAESINPKFNSDHLVQNMVKSSNRLVIIEAMKSLRFQISSLDHHKFAIDNLNRSKAKSFCLLINKEHKFQNFVRRFFKPF